MPPTARPAPFNSWTQAKQIDGHPGREWSYALFNSRAEAFRFAEPAELFYEPLSSFDQACQGVAINLDQSSVGALDDIMHRIQLGLRWHRSGFYADGGQLPRLTDDDEFVGHHMVMLLGIEGDPKAPDALTFFNRWSDWGDEGFGSLSRSNFADYAEEIWLNRPSTTGPSPEQRQEMARATYGPLSQRLQIIRRAWSTPRPIRSRAVLVADRPHELYRKDVISVRTKRRVRILELRHREFGAIGRVHVHVGGEAPSEIDELFIWPARRRQRYGSFLLEQALNVARDAGHTDITAPIYDGDLLSVFGPGSEAFLESRGFVLDRADERMPRCRRRGHRRL